MSNYRYNKSNKNKYISLRLIYLIITNTRKGIDRMNFKSVKLNKIMIVLDTVLLFILTIILLVGILKEFPSFSIIVFGLLIVGTLSRMAYHFWRLRKLRNEE